MKEMKRILSIFLCLVMLVGMLPVSALAVENEETEPTAETVAVESSEPTETTQETEATEPEETEPEETKETEPEETEPEETEETEPEETESEETEETEPEEIAVTGITLSPTRLEVGVGELPMVLTVTVLPEDATDQTVTWTSSEPGVVSVDEEGTLTFGYMGEAVITATAGEFSAECTVIVGEGEGSDYSGTIYVLAGGDFQAGDNGQEDHYYSRINMGNILDKIKENYTTMNGFIFVGDYDGDTHNDSNANTGVAAMMEEVSERFSTLNHDNSYLIEGNHETGAVSGIDATGGYDCGGYAVYLINETDFCERQEGKSDQIQTVADNLKTWLNKKIGEGYDAPIFVATHTPLGYTTRTYTNGDSLYGKYVFDVLNDAAANGLNIIFMHGHDHAYGADNYLGGEAIYLPKGDKINICVPGDKTSWTEETLNFTYMNAGYVGYYNENYYDVTSYEAEKLTMTVFAIKDNQVTVERWSKDGLYNLKSAGREGFYANASSCSKIGLSYNTDVYASPQTIALTTASGGSSSGGTAGSGTIGDYVNGGVTDNVTTSGGKWVTITEATNGTEGSNPTYQYVLDTNGIDAGSDNMYIIVAEDQALALHTSGSSAATAVSVDISGTTLTTDTRDYEYYWDSTYGFTRGSYGLNQSGYNIYLGELANSYLNGIINNNDGTYCLYDTVGTRRTLYYNGSKFTVSEQSNYTDVSVRLYKFDQVIPGSDATPGSNGLYGYLDGELRYEVACGTSAADALAAVKAGIAVKYTTYEDYSNVGEYADDGEGMKWVLDEAYGDGTTPGTYAVTITYNKTVLGTAEVVVPSDKYYIAEGADLYEVPMDTTEVAALTAVKEGITVYSATDANGTDKTPIDDSEVTWNWVDTYDGKNVGPYTVEILYNGTSLGTVEVKVNVQYDTGIADGWIEAGTTPTQYRYVLDTDGYETGSNNRYLFVASDAAYAMDEDGTGVVPVTFNADETEATVDSRDYEWYIYQGRIGGSTRRVITKTDSSSFLYHADYTLHLGTNDNGYWTIDEGRQSEGLYRFYNADGGSTWYLRYHTGGYMGVTTSTDRYLRLYKYDGEIAGGTEYARIEGNTVYYVNQGKSSTSALNAVKAGITGYISSNADGSDATELDDSKLDWEWKNTYNGNVTGSYFVEISYNGQVLGTVQVIVQPGVVNNYPEYPDEGAVKVNKTATGIDFQSSGVAQVEVSASGVPMKKGVDVIVMLDTSSSMTSHTVTGTSQTRAEVLEESLEALIAQFKTPGDDGQLLDIKVAIADFNGFYGNDHNASGTPYDRDAADMMLEADGSTISYTANSEAQVYTGSRALNAGAFIDAADLANSYTLNYTSGTNYDYAMDAIYQLGTAIKEANGSEERDLFVIFMSDGAAMQWNYYHSQGASSKWNNWITGAWNADDLTTTNLNCTTHAYYYDEVDHDGDGIVNEHRMANAIKGDPSEEFEVIRKTNTLGTATSETNMYMVPGLGATMFSISFDAQADDQVTEESMDKSIETLASDQTGTTQHYYKVTTADELSSAFDSIGNEIAYAASNARFVDQMGDNYNLQRTPIVDYNGNPITDDEGNAMMPSIQIISYDIYTKAEADAVAEGTEGDPVTEAMIGDRKGTSHLTEVVMFSADGTQAYSNLIDVDKDGTYGVTVNEDGTYTISDTDDNILHTNGVIYATTFLYNTGITDVAVDGVDIPTSAPANSTTSGSTNVLPSETFYWKLGTVTTSELAMRYYVYLDGSMEGTREAGSHPTNEYAILYYDNYLGNPCHKDTTSPVMAWKSANVSYAFYLVNADGEIIVNQTTGQTGSFANKIAVTAPVVYEEILLNNTENYQVIDIAAVSDDVLPRYYTLYDEGAVYEITINSDATGEWEITKGEVTANSTYVTQYNPGDASAYSNEPTENDASYDYTHTVVWFAVVWSVGAHPDAVVVDYGLPVDISVLTNDMFGENGKLAGIGPYYLKDENGNVTGNNEELLALSGDTALAENFGSSYTGTYGVATADTTTGKVRYTLNTMGMDGYDKFAYAVNYTGTTNPGYYYDTVTVIPATTIYYEDSFVDLESYTWDTESNGWAVKDTSLWSVAGTEIEDLQDEDRPGQYSLTDANNIYGYDSVNLNMSIHSMGSAMKASVDYDNYAAAKFTFYGTGFDVVSLTNATTGSIVVNVYKSGTTEKVKSLVVDTYYGYKTENHEFVYTYTDGQWKLTSETVTERAVNKVTAPATANEGDTYTTIEQVWVVDPDSTDTIYQVPVIKVENLTYGQYDVEIKAVYDPIFEHVEGSSGYDFYLDAIRIYDPANDGVADGTTDTTIEDAYKADGEAWPSYIELRNKLITADTLGNATTGTKVTGLVFIDGDAEVGDAQISDYVSYGPNNEVYLAPGQRVAFLLETPENIANVHIGIKSADGNAGSYTITNIAKATDTEAGVEAGAFYGQKTHTISTTTDMYYDITGYKNDIIVISNYTTDTKTTGIISLTNIKSTYTSDPNGVVVTSGEEGDTTSNEVSVYMTPAAATLTLRSLNASEPVESTPGDNIPEETVPETTEPEETEPEETVPETTVPEETVPETTVPEETVPEETTPEDTVEQIKEAVKNVINTVVNVLKNLFGGWFR